MQYWILSGLSVDEFKDFINRQFNSCKDENEFGFKLFDSSNYRYFKQDFKFLDYIVGDSIYAPAIPLADYYKLNNDGDIDKAVQRVISSCNWSELRHRLKLFYENLQRLHKKYGTPDRVNMEFIREDFLNDKKKGEIKKHQDKGQQEHTKAVEELEQRNIKVTYKNTLKMRLLLEQKKQCVYTGGDLLESAIESYDIEHIFPRELGGPTTLYNLVVCKPKVNEQKGCDIPIALPLVKESWSAYNNRVNSIFSGRKYNRKRTILTALSLDEAQTLIEKYSGLAGTAHIARLARDITCLYFNWQPAEQGKHQKFFVFSGSLTNKIAKKYKLYNLLLGGENKKNREDKRHHALDAMVISYMQQWMRDGSKEDYTKLPDDINKDYFKQCLDAVIPKYITKIKPTIAEQPVGFRKENTKAKLAKGSKRFYKKSISQYINVSKDKDERGQYYKNNKDEHSGTQRHGTIFYKNTNNKLCFKSIHSFSSLYNIEKTLTAQGAKEIYGIFRQKQSIYLNFSDNKIRATQLGTTVSSIDSGHYKILKLSGGDTTIQLADKPQADKYRIKTDSAYRIFVYQNFTGNKTFTLKNFELQINTEKQIITGEFTLKSIQDKYFEGINLPSDVLKQYSHG